MNGGYIIIKDDISSKITTNGNATVNYKGAFDYAMDVFRTGKIALISLNIEGLVSNLDIMQVGSKNSIFWFFATTTDKILISFNETTPDAFTVSVTKGA